MPLDTPRNNYEYNTLMDMLHVSVSKHLLDQHFTLVWANDYYYEMIGYPKAEYEALYHNRPDLYYREDPQEWEKLGAAVREALGRGENGYVMVSRMRRKGGEYLWLRLAATFVDEYIDGCQVAYTVMTDISDIMRIQAEQSVTYDNLPGFVGRFRVGPDMSFTLLDANERFVNFFGEGCWNNLKDPLFRENIRRNAEVIEAQRERFLSGEAVHFTSRMQDQFGCDNWLQINAACVEWQGGDPVYLAIFIDVTNETELRQMQRRLEEQARELKSALALAESASRAKSDFLSHMSHDIRTPMNAIMGMTEIARAHLGDEEKLRDCLRKVSLSSQHLLGLINDVLDMSRIESGKMTVSCEAMSLPELLENVVAIIQPNIKAKSQSFSIRLHRVCHEHLESDALRLRQIFINILSNAAKFTPAGGSVTMDVEELPQEREGEALFRFSFADSGMGMKEEFLQHIFDPFSRERDSRVDKTEGSGLGMAITKKLVDLLGGEIRVRSRVGEGTLFTVTLPMRVGRPARSGRKLPDLRILVVDDDEIMCEQMAQALENLGVEVTNAAAGQEALDAIAAALDRGEPYDAVFLDWRMPGMDGPETARRVRERVGRDFPILIVSAYDWSDIEEEAQAVGVDGFITKPLFVSTLCRALERYVLRETPAEDRPGGGPGEFAGRRFLLAEDNELNQEIAHELLTSAGAAMDCAPDGLAAVRMFEESPEGWYDVILMDVQMPVMDGYDATRRIRALPRGDAGTVAILAMTADAFAEDIAKAREVGMDGHMAKPLEVAAMKREIARVLK